MQFRLSISMDNSSFAAEHADPQAELFHVFTQLTKQIEKIPNEKLARTMAENRKGFAESPVWHRHVFDSLGRTIGTAEISPVDLP